MTHFMVALFKILFYLADPVNIIESRATGDTEICLLLSTKMNSQDVLPLCQDKFVRLGWNHFWSQLHIISYKN